MCCVEISDGLLNVWLNTDLIFFFRGNVGCQVEQLGPCSIAKMKPARTTPLSKSSVDNNLRDAQSAGFSVLQHASSQDEMLYEL